MLRRDLDPRRRRQIRLLLVLRRLRAIREQLRRKREEAQR